MSLKIKFNFSWINDCFDTTAGGQLLYLHVGHGIFQKVMEKVMESHGILTGHKCMNPDFHLSSKYFAFFFYEFLGHGILSRGWGGG